MSEKRILRYLKFLSENTRRSYLYAWKKWERWPDHSKKGALNYFTHLKESGLADGTIKLHYEALNSVYEIKREYGEEKLNPVRSVKRSLNFRAAKQVRPTQTIPYKLVRKIVSEPDGKTKTGVRDRALLAVLFGCGLRRFEARMLMLSDIKSTPKGRFFFELQHTKSQSVQIQPIPNWVRKYLWKLMLQRRHESEDVNIPIFIDYFRHAPLGPIAPKTIWRLYRKYTGIWGVSAAPHSARKTGINKLLDDGVPIQAASKWARHASISATEKYLAYRELDNSPGYFLNY